MSTLHKISLVQQFANKNAPLFRELIAAGVDDPYAIAVELNQRGVRGVNGGKWKTTTVVAAIGRGAPELVVRVRTAQLRYPPANLKLAWQTAQQRASTFDVTILPVMRALIAAGTVAPHAIATELNRADCAVSREANGRRER